MCTQAATLRVGNYEGEEVFTPFKSLLPMVDPNDFVIGGWDISGLNMAEAMERAKVGAPGWVCSSTAARWVVTVTQCWQPASGSRWSVW